MHIKNNDVDAALELLQTWVYVSYDDFVNLVLKISVFCRSDPKINVTWQLFHYLTKHLDDHPHQEYQKRTVDLMTQGGLAPFPSLVKEMDI